MFLRITVFVKAVITASLCLISVGCDRFPADPEKSFEKVALNGLAAGYVPGYPWVGNWRIFDVTITLVKEL